MKRDNNSDDINTVVLFNMGIYGSIYEYSYEVLKVGDGNILNGKATICKGTISCEIIPRLCVVNFRGNCLNLLSNKIHLEFMDLID